MQRKELDLLAIILLSAITVSILYFFPGSELRKIVGIPFIIFLPGYSLLALLFPERGQLGGLERVALALGISVVLTALVGVVLDYAHGGVKPGPVTGIVAGLSLIFSLLAWHRRGGARDPFVPRFEVDLGWEEKGRVDKVLTIILLLALLASIVALVYIITTPTHGEEFTEFYLLGPGGKASGYPTDLREGEKASVIIGIANHEYREVNYNVEIWLANQSYRQNSTQVHSLYFFDSFSVTLNSTPLKVEGGYTPQWERRYNFSIERGGGYKLWFLLFKDRPPQLPFKPEKMEDYTGTAAESRILKASEGEIQSLSLKISVSGGPRYR